MRQDFDTRFSAIGADIDTILADEREDYREERQELKDKWNRLDTRRTELAGKDDSAWEEFKDELQEGWDDIKRTYDDLKRRLGD